MRPFVRSKLVSNKFKEIIFGLVFDAFCRFEVARHPGSVCVELHYGIVLRDEV